MKTDKSRAKKKKKKGIQIGDRKETKMDSKNLNILKFIRWKRKVLHFCCSPQSKMNIGRDYTNDRESGGIISI